MINTDMENKTDNLQWQNAYELSEIFELDSRRYNRALTEEEEAVAG